MSKGVWETEVVVVGAGVHGSCAALSLARAGVATVLLEQFPLPHSRGSSHGQSRIIRYANTGSPALTSIMAAAPPMWRRLQEQAGTTLLRPGPLLVIGQKGQEALQHAARSVEQTGHSPTWLTAHQVNAQYGFNLSQNNQAFLDTNAGVLMADKCVAAVQRLFREAGGRLLDGWGCVDGVAAEDGGRARVWGAAGEVRASRAVVLCPGPWAGPLLATLHLHLPLKVERISVFYWTQRDPGQKSVSFIDMDPSYSSVRDFYGLAQHEYPGLVKVVAHGGTEVNGPDTRDVVPAEERQRQRERTQAYVTSRLPCLHPDPAVEESCLYTVTPDFDFIVDRHPHHPNIVFACGFSGTGFKIAPVIGEELCRLALGLPPLHDLTHFSAARFLPPRSKV